MRVNTELFQIFPPNWEIRPERLGEPRKLISGTVCDRAASPTRS